MININREKFYLSDVEDYIKKHSDNFQTNRRLEVVDVNSTAFNNGTGRDYEFCMPIKHPETGEELRPVRGYVGFSEMGTDRCYYAEFQDKKGVTYSYAYQFAEFNEITRKFMPAKSISQQMKEDNEARLANESAGMGM